MDDALTREDHAACLRMRAMCACDKVRRATRPITAAYDAALAGSGLKATQLPILVGLGAGGPMPLTSLAAGLDLDRTTLTRNVRILEERGLVTSGGHEDDARVRMLSLTPEGTRTLSMALARWQDIHEQVEAAFGEERLRALYGELEALAAVTARA